jgi:hypothetical protein
MAREFFCIAAGMLMLAWGRVKARYHAVPGMTVTPGANSR